MSVQSDGVKEVIFAGTQFVNPFSHSPGWLEDLIKRGVIFKEDGGSFQVPGYGSVDTATGWFYILPNNFVNEPFRTGDRVKLISKDSSGRHEFTVIKAEG